MLFTASWRKSQFASYADEGEASMSPIDRSEEYYAKIAAMPKRARIFLDFLSLLPPATIVYTFYHLIYVCPSHRMDGLAILPITVLLSSCVLTVAALAWALMNHPSFLRWFGLLPQAKKITLFSVLFAAFSIIKQLSHPWTTQLDALHIRYCEGQAQSEYASEGRVPQ